MASKEYNIQNFTTLPQITYYWGHKIKNGLYYRNLHKKLVWNVPESQKKFFTVIRLQNLTNGQNQPSESLNQKMASIFGFSTFFYPEKQFIVKKKFCNPESVSESSRNFRILPKFYTFFTSKMFSNVFSIIANLRIGFCTKLS